MRDISNDEYSVMSNKITEKFLRPILINEFNSLKNKIKEECMQQLEKNLQNQSVENFVV